MFQNFPEPEQGIARRRTLAFLLLVNVFAAILAISYGIGAWRDFRAVVRGEEKLQIAVNGEGKVTARPDVAKITAAILTQHELLKAAQEENSRKSNVLVGYLKSMGVEEKDIKTVGYNIFPQYRYPRPCPFGLYPCPPEESPRITGYQVRNSYEVTIRDLAKAGEILAGIVGAGANEVSGITFTIDNPDELKAEARKKAIDDARVKAGKLAKDLGRRLGRIISFSEGGYFPPPIFLERGLAVDGKGGDIAPSVQPGENEIMVTVSITYEFK